MKVDDCFEVLVGADDTNLTLGRVCCQRPTAAAAAVAAVDVVVDDTVMQLRRPVVRVLADQY